MNIVHAGVIGLALMLAGCQPIVAEPDAEQVMIETPAADTATMVGDVGAPAAGEDVVDTGIAPTATLEISATMGVDDSAHGAGDETAMPGIDAGAEDQAFPTGVILASFGYTPEQVVAGQEIYRQQYCGVCHQLEALGTRGTFGPPHDHAGAVAAERVQSEEYTGNANDAAAYLYESLVQPEIFLVPGYQATAHHMPPYTHLAEEDVHALVAYLLAQQ